jgi:hypothetical protein
MYQIHHVALAAQCGSHPLILCVIFQAIYNEWSSMKFYIGNWYCNYNDLLLRLQQNHKHSDENKQSYVITFLQICIFHLPFWAFSC